MKLLEKMKREFSFFRGNYLILIISWILMDFAGELPRTYYSDYVLQLGGTPTILGVITLVSMLALASVQFPGGYLADKYGRRWLVWLWRKISDFRYLFKQASGTLTLTGSWFKCRFVFAAKASSTRISDQNGSLMIQTSIS